MSKPSIIVPYIVEAEEIKVILSEAMPVFFIKYRGSKLCSFKNEGYKNSAIKNVLLSTFWMVIIFKMVIKSSRVMSSLPR